MSMKKRPAPPPVTVCLADLWISVPGTYAAGDGPAVCLLPVDHRGPHEWTADAEASAKLREMVQGLEGATK